MILAYCLMLFPLLWGQAEYQGEEKAELEQEIQQIEQEREP